MSRRGLWSFIALLLAGIVAIGAWYRPTVVAQAPLLPMTFGHTDHRSVDCTTCHHNFVDNSGAGICIDCHHQTPELKLVIEEQFHTLCRDCHAELAISGEPSGPLRSCKGCHVEDDAP